MFAGITACILYALATGLIVRALVGIGATHVPRILLLSLCGIVFHGVATWQVIQSQTGLHLGVVSIGTLFTLVIVSIGTLIGWYRSSEALLAPAWPMAILSLLLAMLVTDPVPARNLPDNGIAAHILLSLIAYSLVLLAFSQALLLWIQNYQLKHRHIHDLLRLLPPLQTMEAILFDLLRLGLVLLGASIVTGFIYVDDIFDQHLAHKTVFTLLSFGVFLILLAGRSMWGWRGMIAVHWTLIGFALLALGYFGSKIVLELILHRWVI
jgi:ABC-type uncharacterized transport system permease subunit